MAQKELSNHFHSRIVDLLQSAREKVVKTVNQTMVLTYFEIGRMIIEEEQGGKERAKYGKQLLKGLSKALTDKFGKGFSIDNLENMRRFYLSYENSETLSRKSYQNKSVVKYILPEHNEQIFASKYKTILPSKEELKLIITENS